MDIVCDTSQVQQLEDLWRRAPEITSEEMLRAVTECDLLTQGELMQKLPRGAGGLHGAGVAGTIFREEHVLADNVIGLTASKEPYAEYLETGTRPHAVGEKGIQSIMDWVEARIGLHGDEAKGMAFGIGWKIFHHGTAAHPVWQPVYTALMPQYIARFNAAVLRITQRLTGAIA